MSAFDLRRTLADSKGAPSSGQVEPIRARFKPRGRLWDGATSSVYWVAWPQFHSVLTPSRAIISAVCCRRANWDNFSKHPSRPSQQMPKSPLRTKRDYVANNRTLITSAWRCRSNEEDLLTHEVSDEALEAAGGNEAGNFTMAACTFHVGCAG